MLFYSTNATVATCITSSSSNLQNGEIEMTFDNGRRSLEGKYFTYVEDPSIQSVKSGRAGQAGLVSSLKKFFYV